MAAARMVENGVPGAAALERFLGANVLGVVREGTLRLLHRDVADVALALCNAATMSSLLEGGDFQEEGGEGEDHMQADDEASSAAQPQSALQAFMQMVFERPVGHTRPREGPTVHAKAQRSTRRPTRLLGSFGALGPFGTIQDGRCPIWDGRCPIQDGRCPNQGGRFPIQDGRCQAAELLQLNA